MALKDPKEKALGFRSIYEACKRLYPDQSCPLQVASICKFRDGGPDPLDYIQMYFNSGDCFDENASVKSPPHWHYVTAGLSNLYGDTMYSQNFDAAMPSGYGFELTFRLKREVGEQNPPTWPAPLLQSLARYVFRSQSELVANDHIPWTRPLDEQQQSPQPSTDPHTTASPSAPTNNTSSSKIRHMVLVQDSQLKRISTPHGYVNFLQVVGVTNKELQLVQRCTTERVTHLLSLQELSGGPLLVTNMRRRVHVLRLVPSDLRVAFEESMQRQGSNLSGVTTDYIEWAAISPAQLGQPINGECEAALKRQQLLIHKESGDAKERRDSSSSSSSDVPLSLISKHHQVEQRQHSSPCFMDETEAPEPGEEYVDVVGESSDTEGANKHCHMDTTTTTTTSDQCSSATTVTPAGHSNASTPCTPLARLSLCFNSGGGGSSSGGSGSVLMPCRGVESGQVHAVPGCLELRLRVDAAKVLPVAVRDRLRHGAHFTYLHSHRPDMAITLVPPHTADAFVSEEQPYAKKGAWLQIYLPDDFLEQLEFQFSCIEFDSPQVKQCLPMVFRWPERKLRLCIMQSPADATTALPVKSPTGSPLDLAKAMLSMMPAGLAPREIPPPELLQAMLKSMQENPPPHPQHLINKAAAGHKNLGENLPTMDSVMMNLVKQFMYLK